MLNAMYNTELRRQLCSNKVYNADDNDDTGLQYRPDRVYGITVSKLHSVDYKIKAVNF